MKILVLNWVNLNMLGNRSTTHYGAFTLAELNKKLAEHFVGTAISLDFKQSNHEGEIVEILHRAADFYDAVVLNAGAYTHYSYAIRDAIECAGLSVAEVHLSDISTREQFRKISVLEEVCCVRFYGKKADSYIEAINWLTNFHKENKK